MDPSIITTTVQASKEVLPDIYKDGLQPTVKEVGKNLHTVSKLVTIALTPISALVWGYEKIGSYLVESVSKRLQNVPEENIVQPALMVAGPAVEALRFTGHNEELRELFANLLARSMNKETASLAHPSFVEIIKQLSPDEAKLLVAINNQPQPTITIKASFNDKSGYRYMLRNFSSIGEQIDCEHPELISSYFINLERLGLIKIVENSFLTDSSLYTQYDNHPTVTNAIDEANQIGQSLIEKCAIDPTPFGDQFFNACIKEFF